MATAANINERICGLCRYQSTFVSGERKKGFIASFIRFHLYLIHVTIFFQCVVVPTTGSEECRTGRTRRFWVRKNALLVASVIIRELYCFSNLLSAGNQRHCEVVQQ